MISLSPNDPAGLWDKVPERTSLAQTLARQILEGITSGRLAVGEQLPSESELKAQFGVGRSTVREALNGLVLLGVLEIRHGQGAFVRQSVPLNSLALEEVMRRSMSEQLMESRDAIEVVVARYAAERGSDEEYSRILHILASAEQKVQDVGSAPEESWQFHVGIAEASGNAIFVAHETMISELLLERYGNLDQQPGYSKWEVGAHRALYEAIVSRDPELAAKATTQHHQDMRVILLQGWNIFRESEAADKEGRLDKN